MKFAFKELPGQGSIYLRPVVPVVIEGLERSPHWCLLDTGALHNRFGAWAAEAAGIDLTGAEETRLAIAGFTVTGKLARTQLRVGDFHWEAPVWFCEPWPLGFHLLGQEGFFRWFTVGLRAAGYEIEITREPDDLPGSR